MSTNVIINLAEAAIETVLMPFLVGTIVASRVSISDETAIQFTQPNIVIHTTECEEIVSPGSGIYKMTIGIILQSHVKENTKAERDAVVSAITNFAYSDPATALSAVSGFHCYGFEPKSGSITLDPETKSYNLENYYQLTCMPRDNA